MNGWSAPDLTKFVMHGDNLLNERARLLDQDWDRRMLQLTTFSFIHVHFLLILVRLPTTISAMILLYLSELLFDWSL